MQRELSLLAEITRELKEVDNRLVARCKTVQESYQLCMNQANVHRTYEEWAELSGVSVSMFKQCVNTGKQKIAKNMRPEAEARLQTAAGNMAPSQWRKLLLMGLLDHQRSFEQKRAELLAELAAMDRRRVAR